MLNVIFALVLVGITAAVGAYLIANPGTERDPVAGAGILVYAALVAGLFAVLFPEGRLSEWNVVLKMPGAVVAGCAIGVTAGWWHKQKEG